MKDELYAAVVTLIEQIDDKWPSRDKSLDNISADEIIISDKLFGEDQGEEQAQTFVSELISYCADGKDGSRIGDIVYKGQVANVENWELSGSDKGHDHSVLINFTDNAKTNGSHFKLPIFRFFDETDDLELSPVNKTNLANKNQDILLKSGYLKGSATGQYDGDTNAAIRSALKEMVSPTKKPKGWPKEFVPGGFMPPFPGESNLSYGQNNDDVKEVQMHLINKGFLKESLPNGEYNDATADAVKNFVSRMTKQDVDGKKIDEPTWKRIIGGYSGKWLN